MKKECWLKTLYVTVLVALASGILYLFIGCIVTNPDEVIERNSEYIVVREYKMYNSGSTINKYPTDKIYDGVVIDKEKHSYYVGVPGKGGHPQIRKHVTIQFDGRTLRIESSSLYNQYNEGDGVKVKEVWYPRHDIIVL
jgi:hypothetical protein